LPIKTTASEGYEDPLAYLPRRQVRQFAKNCAIYDVQNPATDLYVVVAGRVKVTSIDDGIRSVSRLVRREGLFGELSLVNSSHRNEVATALDVTAVMSWSREEIELQIEREPCLGIALWQYMVRASLELQDRIESMAVHKTPERVSLALLQLSAELGSLMPDGALRLDSLTHQTIAEFVGTSREIVTCQMNRLRRMGLLRYSRKNIDIYSQALRETLIQQGVSVPSVKKAFQVA